MRVSICIPHYFKPSDDPHGYGSTRQTARVTRILSLGRCIGSVLSLQRSTRNCLFTLADKAIDHFVTSVDHAIEPVEITLTVCTDGKNMLGEVLEEFRDFINIKSFDLEDPRQLPIATRDWLLKGDSKSSDADLYAYLEDDLVIQDEEFFDKQSWFLSRLQNSHCLMPHRYEPVFRRNVGRLLIDGPLRPALVRQFAQPQLNAGRGVYREQVKVSFDIAENPHSGLFVVNREQRDFLSTQQLPVNGFISPLETAATLTVLKYFRVCKPSLHCHDFLTIEHGHPSFTSFMNQWEHRPISAARGTSPLSQDPSCGQTRPSRSPL